MANLTPITIEHLLGDDNLVVLLKSFTQNNKLSSRGDGTYFWLYKDNDGVIHSLPKEHFLINKGKKSAIAVGVKPNELQEMLKKAYKENEATILPRLIEAMKAACDENDGFNFIKTDEEYQIKFGDQIVFQKAIDETDSLFGHDYRNFRILQCRISIFKKIIEIQKREPLCFTSVEVYDNRLYIETATSDRFRFKFESYTEQLKHLDDAFDNFILHKDKVIELNKFIEETGCSIVKTSFRASQYSMHVEAPKNTNKSYIEEFKRIHELTTQFKSHMQEMRLWFEKDVKPFLVEHETV